MKRVPLENLVDGSPGRPGIGGFSRGLAWGDYDKDGDLDIFVANSLLGLNHLFENNLIEETSYLPGSNWLSVKLFWCCFKRKCNRCTCLFGDDEKWKLGQANERSDE